MLELGQVGSYILRFGYRIRLYYAGIRLALIESRAYTQDRKQNKINELAGDILKQVIDKGLFSLVYEIGK